MKIGIIGRIFKWMVVAFFGSTILAVVALRFIPVYFTPLMFIRCAQQISKGEEIKLKHHWVPLSDISRHLPVAVMASEDQRFLLHHGFDYNAIEQAAMSNLKGGKKRGGSTISQQTAKNVFLWPGRSWVRKGLEAYFTVLIEMTWSKQRIMEVYLNSIEMGPGIYGADAVAQQHFDKTASELFRSECALIAATLPNPIKFSSKSPSPYMQKRKRQIEQQMRFMPAFPEEGKDIDPNTSEGGVYRNR
ncbi:MAG: monofunctional biosynthetic peptidoglycan transglycosylase [Prevotella sp.]|nr:monofunctional biosynthetic peptidoglycan transglycosylase [Paraprevotella sp.]MCI6202115.1 monofunctional biosynthetic peptidoglycan transglycosylase [Paraprevotella sp.]MDD7692540.1 monofunctional biosynthetic peptidoglycan transglycosylase [Prevotella sp.]MDY4408200.1 monofunctional biosynthetic peptidoglycan transglycosylase [Prevotella sp.]